MKNKTRCGHVAIIGRPNVGKSTLLNAMIGKKISITSSKPQTTRHRIQGVKTIDDTQIIFVDTPGIHESTNQALHRYMNRTAQVMMGGVDLILFVIETSWKTGDSVILDQLTSFDIPIAVVINKVDRIKSRTDLLPYLQILQERATFADLVPVSADKIDNIDELYKVICHFMPEAAFEYKADEMTNRSQEFLLTEILREKLMRMLGDELPYAVAVTMERFIDEPNISKVYLVIWVERESQKHIVIGKGGRNLKTINQMGRQDMESLLEKKVYLEVWVKVKENWSSSEKHLRSLGYD